MKKRILAMLSIVTIAATLCACGEKEDSAGSSVFEPISPAANEAEQSENTDGGQNTEGAAPSTDAVTSSADNADNAQAQNNTTSDDSSAGEITSYEKYWEYTSPKNKDEVTLDAESEKLYDGFLSGSEKAVFSAAADKGQYVCLSEFLTDGEAYTHDEIAAKATEEGRYGEGWEYRGCSGSYIDCGLDGTPELIVWLDFDSEFRPVMVLKNIGGRLKICFAADSWGRCETEVKYNGVISSFGSGGATSHGGYEAYIDADGIYHFYYNIWEEFIGGFGDEGLSLPELSEDLEAVEERISFNENAGEDNSDYYYYFYVSDKDMNDVADDPSDAGNPYEYLRQEYKAAGFNVITKDEADKLQEEARKKIGLTDEIYNYGKEYMPKQG